MKATIAIEIEENKNSLSDEDKYFIKQSILKAVENGCTDPEMLASRCCSALERVNRYGKNTGIGSCGANSTTAPE